MGLERHHCTLYSIHFAAVPTCIWMEALPHCCCRQAVSSTQWRSVGQSSADYTGQRCWWNSGELILETSTIALSCPTSLSPCVGTATRSARVSLCTSALYVHWYIYGAAPFGIFYSTGGQQCLQWYGKWIITIRDEKQSTVKPQTGTKLVFQDKGELQFANNKYT